MKIITIAIGLLVTTAISQAQPVHVGVFHKQAVVVAFYRSALWLETIKSKKVEMETATRAQDKTRMKELEDWGSHGQEVAHRQLAGEAPLTNILEALKPAFAAIAAQSQLTMVVGDMPYASPAVVTVDITGQLLDWLKADDQTRSIVKQLVGNGSGKE